MGSPCFSSRSPTLEGWQWQGTEVPSTREGTELLVLGGLSQASAQVPSLYGHLMFG